jgi:ketosteroid isomerase-like protein
MSSIGNVNIEHAKKLYALFCTGDFAKLVEGFTEDVDWYSATGAPYGGHCKGREAIVAWLRDKLDIAYTVFEPTRYLADAELVVVFVRCVGTVKSTGKPLEFELVHRLHFVDGLMSYMYEFNSDARLIAAAHEQ